MELSVILVFTIILITIALFVTELFPIDKIAFLIIVSLVILGLVTPEEAISGFSNPATITILSLMILAIGLEENGVIQWLTDVIKKLKVLPLILIMPAFMVFSAGISAFISTTAVVIIFIKIVSQLSSKYNFSSAKLLMPISFAGILGGSCTLMGTSTNLLVNEIAENLGATRFSFFEFSVYGVIFIGIGVLFMIIASRWLPKDKSKDLRGQYEVDDYVFTVRVEDDSNLVGKRLEEIEWLGSSGATLLKLIRNNDVMNAPGKYVAIKPSDNLVLMSDLEQVSVLASEEGLVINDGRRAEEEDKYGDGTTELKSDMSYVEIMLLPGSNFLGKTLKQLRRFSFEGAFPIAIKKRKNVRNTKQRLIRKEINDIRLKPGDRVLLEMREHHVSRLHQIENIAILNEHDFRDAIPTRKKLICLLILLGVIGLAASGVLSILSASLCGVGALLLTKSVQLDEIYHKVNWQIIFLLAGMIPLGVAMTNSGAAEWLSEVLLNILEGQRPMIILGLLFAITMIISGTISNNATAIIMTPIAIALATGLNLELKPFVLAVMFGANFSFFTPVGYQTNTLIYGTGLYEFKHFLIIGGLLSIILWITGTLLLTTLL